MPSSRDATTRRVRIAAATLDRLRRHSAETGASMGEIVEAALDALDEQERRELGDDAERARKAAIKAYDERPVPTSPTISHKNSRI